MTEETIRRTISMSQVPPNLIQKMVEELNAKTEKVDAKERELDIRIEKEKKRLWLHFFLCLMLFPLIDTHWHDLNLFELGAFGLYFITLVCISGFWIRFLLVPIALLMLLAGIGQAVDDKSVDNGTPDHQLSYLFLLNHKEV